jgi:hypothetical protein
MRLWQSLAICGALLIPALGQFPSAELQSQFLKAVVYLPDPQNGYYRSTRFDWAGIVRSLKFAGHEYFGPWFAKHDPLVHDAITGPVDVFDPEGATLGYPEAKPGGQFLRIGVGTLEKPDEAAFRSTYTYRVVDPGRWSVDRTPGEIVFRHQITGPGGYAYSYRKTVTLSDRKPELLLSYELTNTGSRTIDTVQFNHNFFTIDGQVSGPGMFAMFGFTPRAPGGLPDFIDLHGNEISFRKALAGQERIYVPLEGYAPKASDYDIRIENRKSGCGVRITSDRPLEKLIFWSRTRVVGPEPYIRIHVEPGKTQSWQTRYAFYTL